MAKPDSAFHPAIQWLKKRRQSPFPFQEESWTACLSGMEGLLNAPTGSGKTFALFFPTILEYCQNNPSKSEPLRLLWITPLRALSADLKQAMVEVIEDLNLNLTVGIRTGDTSQTEKQKQDRQLPSILITTPESLHILLSRPGSGDWFRFLNRVVIDEWHELIGTKRGVQVELALSRLRSLRPELTTWGISATIGNLEEACSVLLGPKRTGKIIRAKIQKQFKIETLIPESIEKFPWAGHLGIRMLHQVIPIIKNSRSTLIFTNTRSQCEIWFQQLLEFDPELAGVLAIHHGSLDPEIRHWVEQALHDGKLKAVVCTSSLDLGVDFAPVETVVQIGSPKGVARFMQRAGRSGHQPGSVSTIYFLPTHSLEMMEGSALKSAIQQSVFEARVPIENALDVLFQWMVTLSCGDGLSPDQVFNEIQATWAYRNLPRHSFDIILNYLTTGGKSLQRYDEFKKLIPDGALYRIASRQQSLRHRLTIGTIVGDTNLKVSFLKGGNLGTIEEYFISRLSPGDVFYFAGRFVEYVLLKDMTVYVRKSSKGKGIVPSWIGGRMPLSTQLSEMIRQKLDAASRNDSDDPEMQELRPLFDLQADWSALPAINELLVESIQTRDGFSVYFYPFEGRLVHEGLAALFAWRIARLQPMTFSLAMNDYGFELLSDQPIPIEAALEEGLFSTDNLRADIQAGLNETEMAKRRFRDIARIAGYIFTGFPGRMKQSKHLQASSSLIFEVFREHEPDHLLLRQAFEEVKTHNLEEERMRTALLRMQNQKLLLQFPDRPTPFCFPIMADRLNRANLSTEKLETRIRKMVVQLEKAATKKTK